MPKEVVHWGKQYVLRHHPKTDTIGEYWEQEPFNGVPGSFDPNTPGPSLEEYLGETGRLTREPNLEVVWVRPEDRSPAPRGEDQEGHVQIGIDLDMVDMEDRLRYTDGDSAHTFYTDRLTRGQINNLIRVLKRARNAAFGSDE